MSANWRSKIRSAFRHDGALRPFKLLKQDIHNIPKRWVSDWTVFNQLVVASAVYVFFTNLLPGITFASDLDALTNKNWGTIEIVFSTGLCGVIFSILSIQPLTILGVTGTFVILAENFFTLCTTTFNIDFLHLMAWALIHAAWMHFVLAAFNAHDWTMRYVTTFTTEIFSLLNSIIYFHKAIQELQRAQSGLSFAAFLYSIIGCAGTCILAIFLSYAERWEPLFHKYVRMGLREYAAAISIIIWIGVPHIGELNTLDKQTLQVSTSFRPTSPTRTSFFVRFWEFPVPWIFAAIIPGFIITTLLFFDHEVSSIICTLPRYGTRKPGGFALDIVLLGLTTGICGILGIPPSNGLLPQAPLHSESLMHLERESIETCAVGSDSSEDCTGASPPRREVRVSNRVYEQRWSHFLHAAGILACVSPPLQRVLGLTPTSVLAGLFLFMGEQSLAVNPVLRRAFHLLTPRAALPPLPPHVSGYAPVHAYTLTQIVVTVVIFIVTLTKAGPLFPIMVILLVPIRLHIMNRLWSKDVLRFVDRWACRDGTPEDAEERKEQLGRSGLWASESDGQRRAGDEEQGDAHVASQPDDVELVEVSLGTPRAGRSTSRAGLIRRRSSMGEKSKAVDRE